MKHLLVAILVIIAFIGSLALIAGGRLFNLEMNKFFKPKEQAVEREVFENTPSFIQGKNTQIVNLCLEYKVSDNEDYKEALAHVILMNASQIDNEHLNEIAKECIREISN